MEGTTLITMELFVLSTALGMDLFSVAIPIGMNRISRSVILKASAVFATFHIVMLVAGFYIGNFLGVFVDKVGANSGISLLMVENFASIIGAAVLTGLGILMVKESFNHAEDKQQKRADILNGWSLMVLAFSVSVDALAAGFSFGMLDVDLIRLNLILGFVIFVISVIGLSIGRNAGKFLGERSELIGGMVLIFLGGNILWRLLS